MLILILFIPYAYAQFASYPALRARLPGRCHEGDFDCGLGQCVPSDKFHDGKPDCFDASDEWCMFGQFKCGSYCVALHHTFGCLFNPKCDGSSRQPQWCAEAKEKVCADPQSFPCKGYGECVEWRWLMDGRRDCIDGSDEDPEYVRTLEGPLRCHYNKTMQAQPAVTIDYGRPPPPPPPLPCFLCPPTTPAPLTTSFSILTTPKDPFVTLISATQSSDPFDHLETIPQGQGSQPFTTFSPHEPWIRPVIPVFPYPTPGDHHIGEFFPEPIKPLDRGVPPAEILTTSSDFESTTGSVADTKSHVDVIMGTKPIKNKGSSTVTHVDLHGNGTSETTHIALGKGGQSEESYETQEGDEGSENEGNPKSTGATHIDLGSGSGDIVIIHSTKKPSSKPPEQGTTTTTSSTTSLEESSADVDFFIPPIRPVTGPPLTAQPIVPFPFHPIPLPTHGVIFKPPDRPGSFWPDQGLIPIRPGIPMPTPWTYLTTPGEPFQPVRPVIPIGVPVGPEVTHVVGPAWPTIAPGGLFTIGPGIIHATESNTHTVGPIVFPTRPSTLITDSPNQPTVSSHVLQSSTETSIDGGVSWKTTTSATETEGTTKVIDEETEAAKSTKLSTSTTFSSSESTTLTSTTKENTCLTEISEYAKSRYPTPMCGCEAGMMPMEHGCEVADTATFKLNFESICGVSNVDKDVKRHLALSTIRESIPLASCIRESSDDENIVVSVLCKNCNISYINRQINKNHTTMILANAEALNGSLCEDSYLNSCHDHATCEVHSNSLRYECHCKAGTNDTSNGRGRICEGIPEEDDCVMIFGACMLFWLMILLGLLFLLPLLGYCFYMICCSSCNKNAVHPITTTTVTRGTGVNGRKNGMKQKKSEPQTRHVAILLSEALNSSARGTRAMAHSIALAEMSSRNHNNEAPKSLEVQSINEITPPEGATTPASNGARATPSGPAKTPSPMMRGEATSLPGTANVETPILDKGTPTFEITSYTAGTPKAGTPKDNMSVRSIPVLPPSIPLKESATVSDLSKSTPPPQIHTSDSAPSLPNLPLPLPIPITSTSVEVHREDVMDSPRSVRSPGAQPTMWETYRVLGGQGYAAGDELDRQNSSSSLEKMIEARFPDSEKKWSAKEGQEKEKEKEPGAEVDENPPRCDNGVLMPAEAMVTADDLKLNLEAPAFDQSQLQEPSSARSERNVKLAEMLGVTLADEASNGAQAGESKMSSSTTSSESRPIMMEHRIADENDARALADMAERGIDLPLSPRTDSARALKARLDIDQDTYDKTVTEQKQIEDNAAEELKRPASEKTSAPENPVSATPTIPVDLTRRPGVTEMRRDERVITRTTTKSSGRDNPKAGTSKPSTPKEKPKLFVPKKAREKEEKKSNMPRGLKGPPAKRPPLNAHRLQPPPMPEGSSSTDESDPEVSFFKRVNELKQAGKDAHFKDRRKRHRKPERQLSSISEKSAEIASEAALQDYAKDYSVSAPTTTRSLSEWHGFLPKHKRFEYTSDEPTDVDLPSLPTRAPIVSSPEIPDVSNTRSIERLDMMEELHMEKRARSISRQHSVTSKKSTGSLKSSRDLPPVKTARQASTSHSMRVQEPHKGSSQSLISRKIATRRHEVHTSQSTRGRSLPPEDVHTRTGLRSMYRLARSEENLGGRPKWDQSPYREGEKREGFLPPISKSTRSLYNSPRRSLKTGSHTSLHSGAGRSGSSQGFSPIFDSSDINKPPKEELWWGPPMR